MRALPSLAVDQSTSLGRRVFTLLTRAHVPHVHNWAPGLTFFRALLVSPSSATVRAAAGELCCVHELDGFPTHLEASRMDRRVAWLRYGPTMESLVPRIRLALKRGRFLSAAPDRSASYLAEDDLALAAAACLASEKNPAGFHVLAGPQSLTHAQVLSVAREALAQTESQVELQYVPISRLEHAWSELGLSEDDAHAAWRADSLLLRDDLPAASDAFARLTGLTPLSLRRYLQQHQQRDPLDDVVSSAKLRVAPAVFNSPSSTREGQQPAGAFGVSA